jgi:primary-amine oxidase
VQDFIPVIDSNERKVMHIDFPPSYTWDEKTGRASLSVPSTAPPPLSSKPTSNSNSTSDIDADFATSNRPRFPPPRENFDFLPDLQSQKAGFKPRTDIKPLHVVQPEGVSFKMDGNVLTWQKWSMHVAFTHREGIAISTITYDDDGELRPVFYRLSLAEMIVPYAAPEHPHPRKFAFDT